MKLLLTAAVALICLVPLSAQLTPPNEAGITMGHVHLNVKDIDVEKKFWIEQFGATPLVNEKPQLPGVKVPGMLILFYKKDPIHGTEGTSLDHFGFRVHSLPEMEKSLPRRRLGSRQGFQRNGRLLQEHLCDGPQIDR